MARRDERRAAKPPRVWTWLLFGSLVGLVGLLVVVATTAQWGDRAAYRDAQTCGARRADGCVVETTAVVERTRISRRRSDDHLVWLALDDRGLLVEDDDAPVELPEPDVVFPALHPGRPVGVRIWKGEVVEISVEGVGSAPTEHSPLLSSLVEAVMGCWLTTGGAAATWHGLSLRRATGDDRDERRRFWSSEPVGRTLFAAFAGSNVVVLQITVLDVYSPAAAVATGVLASALLAVLFQWSAVRRAG